MACFILSLVLKVVHSSLVMAGVKQISTQILLGVRNRVLGLPASIWVNTGTFQRRITSLAITGSRQKDLGKGLRLHRVWFVDAGGCGPGLSLSLGGGGTHHEGGDSCRQGRL